MAIKFEVRIAAERHIFNDLSACTRAHSDVMREKIDGDRRDGVYYDMMASLVFAAFDLEAKVNFVGWKVFEDGWPGRANIREKIQLLNRHLQMNLDWGCRPLQTLNELRKFRDTLAHGKPEEVKIEQVVDVEPDIWEALRGQWEVFVNAVQVDRCIADVSAFWDQMLRAANISHWETTTRAEHSLSHIAQG